MQVSINRQQNLALTATTGSGHQIQIDGSPEHGGQNSGARPMELVLAGLGSCATMDVLIALKNSNQVVQDITIAIDAKRVDAIPAVFESIHIVFTIIGNDISPSLAKSAVRMSMTRLCSVAKMLEAGGVAITYDYKLNP